MMSSKIFWTYINSHINEVSLMMNDWMVGFISEGSNGDMNYNSADIVLVELDDSYSGGVSVTYGDEFTMAFNSLTIEKMRYILQLVEGKVGIEG